MKKPAAIILSGGESVRMGFPKWKLPVGQVVLLEYIVQSISPHVSRIVVCCGNSKPEIEIPGVEFVLDRHVDCGPIEGIRVGLERLSKTDEFAFVTACDSPFPVGEVIELLMARIEDYVAAIPVRKERVFGMSSLYRTGIHDEISQLIKNRKLRVSGLARLDNVIRIPMDQIKKVDPELNSVFNINFPDDYFRLLTRLEEECPETVQDKLIKYRTG